MKQKMGIASPTFCHLWFNHRGGTRFFSKNTSKICRVKRKDSEGHRTIRTEESLLLFIMSYLRSKGHVPSKK